MPKDRERPPEAPRGYTPPAHMEAGRKRGKNNSNWKGGRVVDVNGYVWIRDPDHPRSDVRGYVYEHILVAEKAMGKPLPPGAMPHHFNEDKADNRPGNLVTCQDGAYHQLLHQRMRALKACGVASWRKCNFCGEYDDPKNLFIVNSGQAHHRECQNAYKRRNYDPAKRRMRYEQGRG